MKKIEIKDIIYCAIFAAVLFTQQFIFAGIPNFQLTFLLIFVYSKIFGTLRSATIILLHVLLNTLLYGGYMYLLFIPMLLGYIQIPILLNTVFKKIEKPIWLALIGFGFGITYSWIMAIPGIFMFKIPFLAYFSVDLVFEIILGISNFITILLLYNILYKNLKEMI